MTGRMEFGSREHVRELARMEREQARAEYRALVKVEAEESRLWPCGDQDAHGDLVDAAARRLDELGGDHRRERRDVRRIVREARAGR